MLAATEALLAEGASYADLNIERIATRAGISRTAFYFYFRDKRELLMRLTEEVNELLYQQADIWFSGAGEPEPEMREALTNIAALYAEHGVLLRAIVEVSTYDEEVAQFWRAHARALRRRQPRGASSSSSAAGRAVVEHAQATVVRAVLDDRAHDVPAPRPGRAVRRAASWSTRSWASGCARSTARSSRPPSSPRGTGRRRSSRARRRARPSARGRARTGAPRR